MINFKRLFETTLIVFFIFSCGKPADSISNSNVIIINEGDGSELENETQNEENNQENSLERTTYYLSSTSGNDSNPGTEQKPWQTISKISSQPLSAGDSIFFKKGDTFKGHLVIQASGTDDKPIVLTSYGSGDQPILTGSVGDLGGGDHQEAIYINNQDNLVFDDLEIQNDRTNPRSDVDDYDSFGIYVHNTGEAVMNNFTFKNMTFKNIYAISQVDPADQEAFNKFEVAGIRFFSDWNKKNINNVLVEDCFFTDLQRFGVHVKHAVGNNDLDNRQTNFVFRKNEFRQIGGTCILPSRTRNCLIEDNIFDQPGAKTNSRMIGRGSAVWNWYSVNTIIQNNQALSIRGILDSHGIHVDHHNVDTFIQYNYMEDCEGGFVEILGDNERAVYRFNISVNDGWRNNPNWKNSNHTIWLNDKIGVEEGHPSSNSYIYNNTVVINRNDNPYETAIDLKANNTRIFNNIFFTSNGSSIGTKQVVMEDDNLLMSHNLFFGNIDNRLIDRDASPVTQNPSFHNQNSGNPAGFQLMSNSPAINAGMAFSGSYSHPPIPIEEADIFANVEAIPTSDFFGQPLDVNATPNIGAGNTKNGALVNLFNPESPSKLLIKSPFVEEEVIVQGIKNDLKFKLYDLRGKLKMIGTVNKRRSIIELDKSIRNGIYTLEFVNETEHYTSKLVIGRKRQLTSQYFPSS